MSALHQVRYTVPPRPTQAASQQNLEVKGQANVPTTHTVCTILSHIMTVVRYLMPKYGKTEGADMTDRD